MMSNGKAEEEEGRNWSELPPELLNLIGRRIIKVKDAIRFRVVCKTWWETLSEQQPLLFHQSSALLMLPYCSNNEQGNGAAGDSSCCRLFMDVARSQYHHLGFEQALKQANCRGSAFGWLFMLQRIPVLFNPLTGDQISLPPITTFPEFLGYFPETVGAEYLTVDHDDGGLLFALGKKYVESMYIDRIAMSAEPNAEGCVLMAICWVLSKRRLAFCKPGGDKWTLLPYLSVGGQPVYYSNIVFWRNKFYAVDNDNRILICDLAVPSVSFLAGKVRRLPVDFDTIYLVVGPADELMLVGRSLAEREEDAVGALNEQHDAGREEDAPAHIEDDRHEVDDQNVEYIWDSDTDDECECGPSYETIKFTVYRLNEETNQWDEVESIGEYALFLGMNTSACLSTTQDQSGYKPDCIYFTDDSFEKHVRRRRGGHDMGIYHLSDGTIESLCCINLYENPSLVWPPPVWVSPAIY